MSGHVQSSRRNDNWCIFHHAHRSCFPFYRRHCQLPISWKDDTDLRPCDFSPSNYRSSIMGIDPTKQLCTALSVTFPVPAATLRRGELLSALHCAVVLLTWPRLPGRQKVLLSARFPLPGSRCHHTAVGLDWSSRTRPALCL